MQTPDSNHWTIFWLSIVAETYLGLHILPAISVLAYLILWLGALIEPTNLATLVKQIGWFIGLLCMIAFCLFLFGIRIPIISN